MGKERPSTSSDPDIVRAAGEGMVKRHSEEGDKREQRQEQAKSDKDKGDK